MRSCLSCILDVSVNSKIRTDRAWNVHISCMQIRRDFHLFPESKVKTWMAGFLGKKKPIVTARILVHLHMMSSLSARRQHPTVKTFGAFLLSPACLLTPFAGLRISASSAPSYRLNGYSHLWPSCRASCAVNLMRSRTVRHAKLQRPESVFQV